MATNTVPIEIVLQDPNNPIVPPSPDPVSPDDQGENTNILVPDTALGTGTTKDGNGTNGIFSGTNATASITSIIVLALALGAIITLLVRRYQKHKKAQQGQEQSAVKATANRKEKLLAATSGTLAALAATVLVGNLLITATNAATNDTNDTTTLATPDKIQIIANRYDDVTIVASAKVTSLASTDTTFGYKIFMSMAGEDSNLYLDGNEASEYYFAPTTRAGLDLNSWGYNFDGEADYSAMPLAADPLMAQQNTSAISDEEFTVYYTMKADKDMPFGVYSGEIAYDIQGYNGFPASLTTMQGMTSEICENTYTPNAFKADGVTIEDNVPTATLTDVRDNKTYTIAKLADGKCWMTQNLDLQKEDLLAGVTLDSTNTDHPADGFALPTSQTTGNDSWGRYQDQSSIDTVHVYDLNGSGQNYYYCLNYDSGPGQCTEYSSEQIPPAELGNYYNWYTATAGTGLYSMATGDADGSICPKGWKVPSSSHNVWYASYGELLYQYGILDNPTQVIYGRDKVVSTFAAPLSLVPTGGYFDGQGAKNVGATNKLWSSSASGNSGAYDAVLGFTNIRPNDGDNRYNGGTVRCVAR